MTGPFRHALRVRFGECDPQGVVYFSRYLDYMDIALTELWRERIGPYGEMVDAGADMVVAEARVRYLASARFDDLVDVEMAVERLGETSVTFDVRLLRGDELLVTGSVRHVFIDPATKQKRSVPGRVRGVLGGLSPRSGS